MIYEAFFGEAVYCAWCGCYLGSTPEEVGDCPECVEEERLLEELALRQDYDNEREFSRAGGAF